jgi:ATP-dependent 26S proteasome regulatory subunit
LYNLPDTKLAEEILRRKLAMFQTADIDWHRILPETEGLSQAELVRASEEAAKKAVLGGSTRITSEALVTAVYERKAASR